MSQAPVTYVTSSDFKKEECRLIQEQCSLDDGALVGSAFRFEVRGVPIKETLEVDIAAMVREEVKAAYAHLRVPCIVEHAGLVFDAYRTGGYPGGLTKPMWNTLGDSFVEETRSSGRKALAVAVVAYCDGQSIHTFSGESEGTIAPNPRGSRKFYWDTVFIPDEQNPTNLTYAEIVDDPKLGLSHKLKISQSTKAMIAFLNWRRTNHPALWSVSH